MRVRVLLKSAWLLPLRLLSFFRKESLYFDRLAVSSGESVSSQDILPRRRWQLDTPSVSWRKILGPVKWTLLAFLIAGLIVSEMRTSALQARLFAACSRRMSYTIGRGPGEHVVFPNSGPFDERLGYSRIPEFQQRLKNNGFHLHEQARFSKELALGTRIGLTPPYREPVETGLVIRSAEGMPLFKASSPENFFQRYEDIPRQVVEALLYIENRELLTGSADCRGNPVVDWRRLGKAALTFVGSKLGLPVRLQGGSTLATQLEKYRHSPGGRTGSAIDKLRQMISASLKVYNGSADIENARRQIILDYLNSVPLGAAPGYGEVTGLGEGLYAWFGLNLHEACEQLSSTKTSAQVFKQVLMLLYAARAPSYLLSQNRPELYAKANFYIRLLVKEHVIDPAFGREAEAACPDFLSRAAIMQSDFSPSRKATNAIRNTLMKMLQVPGLYELDRLHLDVDSTIDKKLQNQTSELFQKLRNTDFLAAHDLRGDHLLSRGDPGRVNYSVLLFESRPEGNLLRVEADTLEEPFDINSGLKLQLGSTAKLRTLAHYLELVTSLHGDMSHLDKSVLAERARHAKDPITRWAAQTLIGNTGIDLYSFLQMALDRTYSASPNETFFTGGGSHTFVNFDREDNDRVLSVREAFIRSVNLVFIRLMRDLVRFHEARLPYDPESVLTETENTHRIRLLNQIAENESRYFLFRAYGRYRGLPSEAQINRLLGQRAHSLRQLAVLCFAWDTAARFHPEMNLRNWFESLGERVSPDDIRKLTKAYGNPQLDLADYAYLLSLHPLEVWCVGELRRDPRISWADLWNRSAEARRIASAWLFKTRNRRAQDLRLRIRIEEDAFSRMTPYWRRLGFPFDSLVPSLATAIGSSSDRPTALAELMGIIVNNGVRLPSYSITNLTFARGTPYHTGFEIAPVAGERVMNPTVARVLRKILAGVVDKGTARRVAGAFVDSCGAPLAVGGKTGSGDNRFSIFGHHGARLSSNPVNRTATFVFFVGSRYFGVITAYVEGQQSGQYGFTSALPLSLLKLLAPAINRRLTQP
jgi:membrane peptidoglycan carboxypeptidase